MYDLILIHRPGGQGRSTLADDLRLRLTEDQPGFFWQTCLRQIALIDESQLESVRSQLLRGDEIYHADVGYRFLLEIVCGLHSPLVGETEVYGQFKSAAAKISHTNLWGTRLARFFRALFEDAKRIRQAHLEDLGSQSYGSVLRRDLKDRTVVGVIGSGQMAKDLLPWLTTRTLIHARDPEKARRELGEGERLEFFDLADGVRACDAVIIAAPLPANSIEHILDGRAPLIIDLRADSAVDRFMIKGARVVDLAEVFARIDANQAQIEERKHLALKAIRIAAHERSVAIENRPFGWEDVCA
jgi:glutamyl-tRNA reductase